MPDTVTNPTKESSRSRIEKAAKSHFARFGFEGASTRHIADSAGVAQSLLLYHFKTKEVLWQTIMDQLFARADNIRTAVAESSGEPAATRLMAGVAEFVDLCFDDADLHRLMTLEGRSQSSRLEWMVETHLRPFFDQTISLIKDGQHEGDIRPGNPTLFHYSIIAIAGTIYSLEPEMSLLDPEYSKPDRDRILELIRDMILIH